MLPRFQNGSRIILIFPKTSSVRLSEICNVTGKGLKPASRLEALLKCLFLLLRSKSQQAIFTKYAQNRDFPPFLFSNLPYTQARNLSVFLGSHLFLSPHSKEVTETCPSCLLLQRSPAPSPAPAQAQTSPSRRGERAPASPWSANSDRALSLSCSLKIPTSSPPPHKQTR